MKKKLLFVTTALWVGGIESALVNLLGELAADYDLTVALLRNDRALAPELPNGCRLLVAERDTWLTRLTEPPTAPSRLHRALDWGFSALRWVEEGRHVRQLARLTGRDYHRILIFSQNAAGVGLRAFPKEKPILFYHQGSAPDRVKNWNRCGKIVAVSEPLAEEMRSKFPELSEKVVAIPNILTGERVLRRGSEFDPGFPADTFNIVTVGRLHHDKGPDLAVEAAAILRDRGLNFRWYLVGNGPEEAHLGEKIQEYGLETAVILTGLRENPYPYMKNADLYVQPSRVEGWGLAISEARILGRPVIATDTLGARAQLPPERLCAVRADALAEKILESEFSSESWDWQEENRKNLAKLRKILKKRGAYGNRNRHRSGVQHCPLPGGMCGVHPSPEP